MNRRIPYLTLVACTAVGFFLTLMLYVFVSGRNPLNRLGYAAFVSVVPAIGALIVIRILKRPRSRADAVSIYIALFILIVILQAAARLIAV